MKHSNVRKIAKLANLSPATVSRYFNGYAYVSTEAKSRIKQAMLQLNQQEQSPENDLNVLVCCLASKQAYEFYHDVIQEMWQMCASEHITVSYLSLRSDESMQAAGMIRKTYSHVDCIVCVGGSLSAQMLDQVCDTGIPVILIDNYHPRAHTVSVDNQQGLALAVHHLHQMGHRRIAFIGGNQGHASLARRFEGYIKAMVELGLEPLYADYQGGNFFDEGIAMTNELLAKSKGFTALIAGGEMMTYGALNALGAAGLKIPADVSLIGFGLRDSENATPGSISSISLMPGAVALFVVELIRMIQKKVISYPVRTYLLPEISLRATCAPLQEEPGATLTD